MGYVPDSASWAAADSRAIMHWDIFSDKKTLFGENFRGIGCTVHYCTADCSIEHLDMTRRRTLLRSNVC